jgi:MoaA/NifB/PqqE/SkfB family radical SAM enzyme
MSIHQNSLVKSHQVNPEMTDLSFIWLEITPICNLTCVHCYAEAGPKQTLEGTMTFDNWVRVISEAASLGCLAVQFIGGEPTLHPKLIELIEVAKKRGFSFIEVFTNASHITDRLFETFVKHNVHVATSFYSAEVAVHEKITGVKGSFRRSVDGIRRIVAANLPLRVGIIEMEENQKQVPQTVEFLKSLGVNSIGGDKLRKVGRSAINDNNESEQFDELCGECWKGNLCITSSGDTFPCIFSRKTNIGNAKMGLGSLLESQTLGNFRVAVKELEKNRGQSPQACDPCHPNDTCAPCFPCDPSSGCEPCFPCSPNESEERCWPCDPKKHCNPCWPCNPK